VDERLFESTSMVLLERLRATPRDEAAWGEFVRGYAPAIRRWCRGWGLQPADADDVTQAVLLRLARTMAVFHYDQSGSFRGYLKALTRYAVCDAVESLRRQGPRGDGPGVLDWLTVEDTRNDLARCLESELRRVMFLEASARVSRRADARTWEAFRLLSEERRPGREVADRLGMSIAAVYMAKSRVVKMLREEVRVLSRVLSDPAS
jgi:RNA polymerase sigma-70 factor, ECF subfamily